MQICGNQLGGLGSGPVAAGTAAQVDGLGAGRQLGAIASQHRMGQSAIPYNGAGFNMCYNKEQLMLIEGLYGPGP